MKYHGKTALGLALQLDAIGRTGEGRSPFSLLEGVPGRTRQHRRADATLAAFSCGYLGMAEGVHGVG